MDTNEIALADLKDLPEWDMLTEKQKIFVLSYLTNWNTRQAAKKAGVATITVYHSWMEKEHFRKVFDLAKQAFIAELENKLFEWIDEKKDARTLLEILKIRGKKYGWGEQIDINHNGKIRVEFVHADKVSRKEDECSPAGYDNDENNEVEEHR